MTSQCFNTFCIIGFSHTDILRQNQVRENIERDGRNRSRDIANAVGIPQSDFILKRYLKVRKISACWIPHALTDKQRFTYTNGQEIAKKLP